MNERQQKILKQLDERGQVSITELSKEFGCSSVTVRNDIRELDKQDQLVRVHGGAVKKKIAEALPGMSAANSLNQHVEEKKQIVARAYEYIKDRDTLILDDSSTCYFLALHIKKPSAKAAGRFDEFSAFGDCFSRLSPCGAFYDRGQRGRAFGCDHGGPGQ
jgi:DeoR/GlpR family transcriptional regulator of sugar metabolism